MIDNLMRNTKEDEIYHINYKRTDSEGAKNYMQLSVARVTDNKGVVKFVCGFRNIDSMMEEEKHRNNPSWIFCAHVRNEHHVRCGISS